MTRLVLHYAPGIIAILRQEPCPGQGVFGDKIGHNTCGCDTDHFIHRIVNVGILEDDEALWMLEQCRMPIEVIP